MSGVMILVLVVFLMNFKRLIPYQYEDVEEPVPYLIPWKKNSAILGTCFICFSQYIRYIYKTT